jgi:D-glycero-alpha-D-manno-heptose-7-phosphate kinase
MEMVTLARKMQDSLNNNEIESFGQLLHKNWLLKRRMATGVSTPQIDTWYKIARDNGATGGKLLGAGGGGFLLFYAPERSHEKIKKALFDLKYQHFQFEPQGSKILFID